MRSKIEIESLIWIETIHRTSYSILQNKCDVLLYAEDYTLLFAVTFIFNMLHNHTSYAPSKRFIIRTKTSRFGYWQGKDYPKVTGTDWKMYPNQMNEYELFCSLHEGDCCWSVSYHFFTHGTFTNHYETVRNTARSPRNSSDLLWKWLAAITWMELGGLLNEYQDIFDCGNESKGRSNFVQHKIGIGDVSPIWEPHGGYHSQRWHGRRWGRKVGSNLSLVHNSQPHFNKLVQAS